MGKKYQLSITARYCHDWTIQNAIREILQNSLDSPAENFFSYEDGVMTIGNKLISIPTKTLLMGVTTKREDDNAVGGKGEGFKLACGILIREGLSVTIYNQDRKWTPVFEYHPDFDEEVLHVYEEPLQGNNNLIFEITGVTEDVYKDVVDKCLYLNKDISNILKGSRGTVIRDFSGKIYVGGLFVCEDHRLAYSYDFKPKYLKLNRDRKSVEDWNLRWETSLLLAEVLSEKEIAELLRDGVFDVMSGEYSYGSSIKEECFKLFSEENAGKIIAKYESDKGSLEQQYSAKPIILNSSAYANLVMQAPSYTGYLQEIEKEDYEEDDRTPLDLLIMLEDYLIDNKQGLDLFNKIKQVYTDKGVYWEDETQPIPF